MWCAVNISSDCWSLLFLLLFSVLEPLIRNLVTAVQQCNVLVMLLNEGEQLVEDGCSDWTALKIKSNVWKGSSGTPHSHTSWSTRPFEGTIMNKKWYLKQLLTSRPPAAPHHPLFKWRQIHPFISLCSGVKEAKQPAWEHKARFILGAEASSLLFPRGKLLCRLLCFLLYVCGGTAASFMAFSICQHRKLALDQCR